MTKLRDDAPSRGVREIGPGDFVKIGSQWVEVSSNSAYGEPGPLNNWTIHTTDGRSYSAIDVNSYAKARDME